MINNTHRVGNLTSSEIVALTKTGSRPMTDEELIKFKKLNPKSRKTTIETPFGEAAWTYINETNMERRLGRSISDESNARPLTWGKLGEEYLFAHNLGPEYEIISKETIQNPEIDYHTGSPDGIKYNGSLKIGVEFKCPMTLKSFCTFVDLWKLGGINAIREGIEVNGVMYKKHPDGEKYYQQCVSNAILLGVDLFELIIFMPYYEELELLREMAHQKDGEEIHKYYWIAMGNDDELPHLKKGMYYKNVYKMAFGIPKEDKEFLIRQIKEAGNYLIPRFKKETSNP